MVSINTNLTDMIIMSSLNDSTNGINKSIERLTSGYKINHAKDNAANLNIVTNLSTKISSLLQVRNNTEDGISLLSTAQGGLEEISNLLKRLRNLSTQAMNGTYGEASLEAMQKEADEIVEQIKYIRENTEFNGLKLFYTPSNEAVNTVVTTAANSISRLNNSKIKINGGSISTPSTVPSFTQSTSEKDISNSRPLSTQSTTSTAPATPKAGDITGAEDFTGSQTRTIVIDNVEYKITNKSSSTQTISYSKDTTTGELTFYGSNFEIHGQSDVSHNLIIEGSNNYVYGGDLADTIQILNQSAGLNTIYGLGGDDTIYSKSGRTRNTIYGGDGNDNITTAANTCVHIIYGDDGDDNIAVYYGRAYGGAGNDILSTVDGYSTSLYGEDGDDTFYVNGNGSRVFGGSGINKVAVDKGTNTVKIDVEGANSFSVNFAGNETKSVQINGIDYEITRNSSYSGSFYYSVNDDGSWTIISGSEGFKIVGEKSKAHNVTISCGSIIFYGGDLDDKIHVTYSATDIYIYGGKGNDNLSSMGYYVSLFGEEGDDTITSRDYAYISGGDGDDTITTTAGEQQVIDAGNGNDHIDITKSSNVTVVGGSGNNTLAGSDKAILLNGFGVLDNAQVVQFAAGETKNVLINGVSYEIKNNKSCTNTLAYMYSPVSGELTLGGGMFTVRGDETKTHNLDIYGGFLDVYTGNGNDIINLNGAGQKAHALDGDDIINCLNNTTSASVSGGNGNDTITLNTDGAVSAYGESGNDTFNIINSTISSTIDGGIGDDVYNVDSLGNIIDAGGNNLYNVNVDNAIISGASGNDTFYISGNNNTILGGGGDDYFVIDGENNTIDGGTGTNLYVDNSSGNNSIMNVYTDPNNGELRFTALGEVKTFTLNGKTYTVTNNLNGVNTLNYSLNPNTGVITINGSDLTINAESDEEAVLNIRGDNNTINGSDKNDRITIEQGSNNVINGNSGDDNIVMQSVNNEINGGTGNDNITLNASTNKQVTTGAGNNTIVINSDNNSQIELGSGNNKVTVNGSDNIIVGTEGNNTITVTEDNNELRLGDGDNKLSIMGTNNSVSVGNGDNTIGIDGKSNILTAGNAAGVVNIMGEGNSVNIENNEEEIVVSGNKNTVTTLTGDKKIKVTGNDNKIIGGDGIEEITIRGNNNSANGGEGNDTYLISSGRNNVIDGETGRNTMINNGENTQYNNVIDITPRPFELNLKVDLGTSSNSMIGISISFNLYDFELDFMSERGRNENLNKVDELIKTVDEELIKIGSTINRLESVLDSQSIQLENMISTRSTLRDADIAEESSELIKYEILQEASATLASATRGVSMEFLLGMIDSLRG